jgi:NitT/TauT family transport system ATP-binding protein
MSVSLRADEVSMTFSSGDGTNEVTAIQSISLEIAAGSFYTLLGPSGCGKSTFLSILAGLVAPTSGRAYLEGTPITGPSSKMAVVFQAPSLFPWRTVIDNVAFGLELRGVNRKARRERAREVINMVGLAGFEEFHPGQLSGGMQQRGAIARALALDPEVLLMDEPFGSLDEQTRLLLGDELLRIWERTQKTVVFVTHSIQEAILLSTEIAVFSSRPSTIKSVLEVPIARPRTDEIIGSEEFRELQSEIWSKLRQESLRAMGLEMARTGTAEGGDGE